MNTYDSRILSQRKRNLMKRLKRRAWEEQPRPMLRAHNIRYEMACRDRAIDCGGLGAFHLLAQNVGLVRSLDENLHLLKRHLPYHESDHVLNLTYNVLTGGRCMDDLELRRNDETFMDALGAQRIPDPTTEGDFLRRFSVRDVIDLMEAINSLRVKMWRRRLSRSERKRGILDLDGAVAETSGECKEGADMAYNGVWGYHPLLISLANTVEPIYLVNRPGNRPSHDGAVPWMDRSVAWVRQAFETVCLRGDTDFALTEHFDRWTKEGTQFVFGMDARKNLIEAAEALEKAAWRALERPERRSEGDLRQRPVNVKERIVIERGYKNIVLEEEHVAEFAYRPGKCRREYRLIALRKTLAVMEGQQRLFEEPRYFFYITNRDDLTTEEVVFFSNDRCDQENLIEQLKNGLNAMRMPTGDLVSNWAYMVIASLAWTMKAWFALLVEKPASRMELIAMEFRRFLNNLIRIPCQIVRTGRRIIYRILGYNGWVRTFLRAFDAIRSARFT